MLSHLFRFHGHGGLRYLYKHGRTARTRNFLLRHTVHPNRSDSRVTVIVSKKVSKSAARRNRIRRRVYENVRCQWDELLHPFDLSITVYSLEVGVLPSQQLARELRHALGAARLYSQTSKYVKINKTN